MKFKNKFILITFFTFFSLQFLFILIINLYNYKEFNHFIKDDIQKKLEICSYKLNCKNVKINFQKKDANLKPFTLYESNKDFQMFFQEKYLKKYYLKLSIDKKIYNQKVKLNKYKIFKQILIETIIIIILSMLFTFFLFLPLKEAYKINETFIKDILHDFNTPISTLKLNLYLLKKEIGETDRIKKIKQNLDTILNYQKNLKTFIQNNPTQKESFNLKTIIDEKLNFYSLNYPSIKFENSVDKIVTLNKSSMESILDNLISNAFKYNKEYGKIKIYMKNKNLFIEDTGIGIKNPDKIFERFYKENERGIGIGMNIVKKLTDELNIKITIKSTYQQGTTIILSL